MPRWLRVTATNAAAVLAIGVVVWAGWNVLQQLASVTFGLLIALLLVAMLQPGAARLRGLGVPVTLVAALGVLVLVCVPVGLGALLVSRASEQMDALGPTLTAGIDDLRAWLTTGPLSLDAQQVQQLRDSVVGVLEQNVPGPASGARGLAEGLGIAVVVVFALFFLIKDGDRMWSWLLSWTPTTSRRRVDDAGRAAWSALTAYVGGLVVVAAIDAVLIGGALLLLGVPLWLSLTLLTFLGAFVPLLGATVAGAAAVLVTLVTGGPVDALIVLGVVLVVQQIEGNVLQPLVMGRAVRLHPLVIVVAVTAGVTLLGIPGALLGVPFVAVGYRVATTLHPRSASPSR